MNNSEHQPGCTAAHRAGTSPCTVLSAEDMTAKRDRDHVEAILEDIDRNLPCNLCGRPERHPNHRGVGHTHIPAEDPEDRAHVLLALVHADDLTVPDAVYESARMMVANDPGEIVDCDHANAIVEDVMRNSAVLLITAQPQSSLVIRRDGTTVERAPQEYEVRANQTQNGWGGGNLSRIFYRLWRPELDRYEFFPELVITDSIRIEPTCIHCVINHQPLDCPYRLDLRDGDR